MSVNRDNPFKYLREETCNGAHISSWHANAASDKKKSDGF